MHLLRRRYGRSIAIQCEHVQHEMDTLALTRHDMRAAFQVIVTELEAMGVILDATGDRMSRYLLDMLLEEFDEVIWRLSDDDDIDTSEAVVNPGIDRYSDRQP